jgi:hypothetical protein
VILLKNHFYNKKLNVMLIYTNLNGVKKLRFTKILVFMMFFSSCQTSSDKASGKNENPLIFKTEVERDELRGKVKVLRQDEYFPGDSEGIIGERTGENSYSFSFNKDGEKTKEIFYDNEGLIKVVSEYMFSNDGRKSFKKMVDGNDSPVSSCEYKYYDSERIIRYNITDYKEKIKYYSESKFDDEGNEILDATYSSDGQKIKSSKFTYVKGRKIRHLLMDHLDTPFAIGEYKYNDKGDAVKEIFYTGNNLLFEVYTNEYTYDEKGNWIMKVHRLEKKYMITSANENRPIGIQSVTLRTLTYY